MFSHALHARELKKRENVRVYSTSACGITSATGYKIFSPRWSDTLAFSYCDHDRTHPEDAIAEPKLILELGAPSRVAANQSFLARR